MSDVAFFKLLNNTPKTDPVAYPTSTYVPRKTSDTVASAPCENCSNQGICMRKKLACQHFAVWMDSRVPKPGHSKIPNRGIYNRIFVVHQ